MIIFPKFSFLEILSSINFLDMINHSVESDFIPTSNKSQFGGRHGHPVFFIMTQKPLMAREEKEMVAIPWECGCMKALESGGAALLFTRKFVQTGGIRIVVSCSPSTPGMR